MVIAILKGRHIAVANEEAIEAAIDDDIEGEMFNKGKDEHSQADA